MTSRFTTTFAACILILAPTLGLATNSGVDPAFGPEAGHYRFNRASYTEHVHDAAIDSQGRILIAFFMQDAGDPSIYWPAVMRLTADGYGDPSFGLLGLWVESSIEATPEATIAIAVDASDRPVIGWTFEFDQMGIPNRDWWIRRLTTSGAVDTGQVVAFDIGISGSGDRLDELTDIRVLADGRIVAVGGAQYDGADWDYAIAVVEDDGSGGLQADSGFDGDGRRTVNFDLTGSSKYDNASEVTVDSTGSLVVVGWSHSDSGNVISTCRMNATSGVLDSTFSADGKATYTYSPILDPSLPARGVDVAPLASGFVIGAVLTDVNLNRIGLLRVLTDGDVDYTFGASGWFVSDPRSPGQPVTSADTTLTDVAVDNDRLIYSASIGDPLDFNQGQGVVGMITLGGAADTVFSPGGYDFYTFEPAGEATDTGFSKVIVPGLALPGVSIGKAVLVGSMHGVTGDASRSDNDLLATRVLTSGAVFLDGFESGGTGTWSSVTP